MIGHATVNISVVDDMPTGELVAISKRMRASIQRINRQNEILKLRLTADDIARLNSAENNFANILDRARS